MKKPRRQAKIAIKTALFSIIGNIFLTVIKGVAGYFGNSYALIADATESASDILASLVVLFGFRYAQIPADENHPYGHGKIEPLVTFIVAGFLFGTAMVIAYQSILNIRSPQETPEPWLLGVLAGVILWKEICFQVIIRKSRITGSNALLAEAWHHRSDAVTSIMAFIGISIALFFGPGYETADDWAALFAAAFIVYHCYHIFRPALGEVMDEHNDDLLEEIRKQAVQVEGIIGTEKCFIRKAGFYYHLGLHVVVDKTLSVQAGHDLAHHLEDHLRNILPQLESIIIHIEPDEDFRKVY